ncbi:MAG TPA: Calx-beta domain-containing protein [Acidimicrobiia bacterium]
MSGRRGSSTRLVAASVVLAVVASYWVSVAPGGAPQAAAATRTITVPSELIHEPAATPGPNDPDRCVVTSFVQIVAHPREIDTTTYHLSLRDNALDRDYTDDVAVGSSGFRDVMPAPDGSQYLAPPGTHRFLLGQGSVGDGCAAGLARTEARWGTPTVTLEVELKADFVGVSLGRGEYRFDPDAWDGIEPYTYFWDFGNGEVSEEQTGHAHYTVPGTYHVQLWVTDAAGNVAFVQHDQVVTAPTLDVTVDYADPNARLALDTPTDVVVEVTAGDGAGPLQDLNFIGEVFVGDVVRSVPSGAVDVVAGPTPAPGFSFALQPGESRSYVVTVVPRAVGRVSLVSEIEGSDAAGNPVSDTAELVENLSALEVTVTPEKDNVELGVDFPFDIYKVTVTVKNISDATTVSDVFVAGDPPIVVGPIDNDLAHKNSVMAVSVPDPDGDGPATGREVNQDSGVIGTLAPGETSRPVEYYLEAIRGGRSPLEVLVRGADGLDSVTALGKSSVNVVEDVLVEFDAHEQPGGVERAGQHVTLDGSVRNLSETRWIKVLAYPDTDLNAGNGFLSSTAGATPTEPEVWTLPPGMDEPLPLRGILVTSPAAEDSQAKVSYTVFAVAADEEAGPYTDVSSQVRMLSGDRSHPIVATLGPADAEIDEILDVCGSRALVWIAWCGFNVGGGHLVDGIGDLLTNGWEHLKDKSGAYLRLAGYTRLAWQHGAEAVLADPVAKEHLVSDIRVALTDMFPVLGLQSDVAQIPAMATALVDEMLQWMTARVGDIVEGDLDQLTFSLAQVVGENPDVIVEGGVKLALTAARRSLLTRISRGFVRGAEEESIYRQAMEHDLAQQESTLASRVDAAEAAGATEQELRKATIPGDDLEAVPGLLRKAWGVPESAIAALKKLCEQEGILILLRGRAEAAIDLIERGLAWAKPEWMKAKSVNPTDVRLFGEGSRAVRPDVVVVAEPPFAVDWDVADPDVLKAQIEDAATEWVDSHPDLFADADPAIAQAKRSEMIGRAAQRAKEWGEYGRREFGLHTGNPTTVEQNIAFDATKQEQLVMPVKEDVRQFRVDTANATENGWTVYEVQMSGPKAKGVFDPASWRAITGDVDLLGILHLDGSRIDTVLDAAKKSRIYRALQEILDIQHGESMSFYDLSERAELLKKYGDELAVVDPLTVRRGKVIDVATVAVDNANAKFVSTPATVAGRGTEFVLIDGIRPVMQSDWTRFLAVKLPNSLSSMRAIVDQLLRIGALRIVLTPLDRLLDEVDGLDPARATDAHTRTAPIVQPDGAGGLWRFRPTGGPVFGSSTAPASLAAAPAVEPPPGWEPISLDAAVALGNPAVLDTAPVTALLDDAKAGSTRVEIAEPSDLHLSEQTDWFEPGDRVVIDPGGSNEEYATVDALGSLDLESPLEHDHTFGELVAFVGEVTGEEPAPTNHAPVCADEHVSVAAGTSVDVAPSCTDDDGDALTYEIASPASTGVASVVGGQLRYAAAAASGADQFTYAADDGNGGVSVPATVGVTVVQCAATTITSTRGTAVWFGSATGADGVVTSSASVTDHIPAALEQALESDPSVDPRARGVAAFVAATTPAQWVAGAAEGLPAETSLRAALSAPLASPVFDSVVPRGTVDLVIGETVTSEPCANAARTTTTRYVARVSLFELDAHEATTGPGSGPRVSVGSASAREGSVWWLPTTLRFPVTLSEPAPREGVTVRYSTVDGTARRGSDFVARSGTLRFAKGQTSATVPVLLVGDRDVEPDETFVLALTRPVGAALGTAEGTGTIVNDDAVVVTIAPVVCGAEPRPGATATFSFPVHLSAPAPAGGLTVGYSTRSGTATAGSDFDAAAGTLAFAPGQRTRTIAVTVRGDTRAERDEQFSVELGPVSVGGTLGPSRSGRGLISTRCRDRAPA